MAPVNCRRACGERTERVFDPQHVRSTREGQPVILVVDPDPLFRALVTRLMEGAGHLVLAAADGQAGLLVSRQYAGPIDLLIVEVRTSQLKGADLPTRLLRERPGLKVIFSISERLSEFFTPSAQLPCLTKPINERILRTKVEQVLSAPVSTTLPERPSRLQDEPGTGAWQTI